MACRRGHSCPSGGLPELAHLDVHTDRRTAGVRGLLKEPRCFQYTLHQGQQGCSPLGAANLLKVLPNADFLVDE